MPTATGVRAYRLGTLAVMAVLRVRAHALRMLRPLACRAAGPLAHFRAAKQLGDAKRLGWLLRIQANRSALADVFFLASSFAGNADFYLLLLPTMIWQGAPKLGRRITYMVTSSLVLGNTLKDVVALPRPPSPPVWRPASGAALDSTAFADFGWPSTHAMNAVTNPLLVAVALAPWWRRSATRKALVVCASVLWCATISFGRLYLGAHSRSDVFAGHVLGAVVAAVWIPMVGPFDAVVNAAGPSGSWLIAGAASLSVALFTLYPSHLLSGASAPQSAELVGLFLGCTVGSRQEAARVRRAGTTTALPRLGWFTDAHRGELESGRPSSGARKVETAQRRGRGVLMPDRAAFAREVVGFSIALGCRELISSITQSIIGAAFHTLRGDVAAALAVIMRKVVTYFFIAMAMTGWSPAVFRKLGISKHCEEY